MGEQRKQAKRKHPPQSSQKVKELDKIAKTYKKTQKTVK